MSIWSSELWMALVYGVMQVAVLTLIFGGVASAHAADRHGQLETRRLVQWRVVRGWDRRKQTLRRHMIRRQRQSNPARVAIVGGSPISIERAPWQVELLAEMPFVEDGEKYVLVQLCGGVILDTTHVLTAGHCMFESTGTHVPTEDFVVVAGSSNFLKSEPTEEEILVKSTRVHPYYSYAQTSTPSNPDVDDVAVVELDEPLVFTSTVQSIALASAGSLAQEGMAVNFTGFGEQSVNPKEENGELYSIGMTLESSAYCGGEADALLLCARTPGGSLCNGDSGGGLTASGLPPLLIGVADTVQVISGEPCRDGASGGFANIAAPEVLDFIEGDESPPKAPRGGTGVDLTSILSPPSAGESLTCSPGHWSGEPSFIYNFINSADRHVLQSSSSPEYQLTMADDGLKILCQVDATNAGGTGVQLTNTLGPVAAETQQAHEHRLMEEERAKLQAQDEALAQEELEAVELENEQAEAQKKTTPRCIVPSLKGDTLTKARRVLTKAHCRLGKVSRSRDSHNGKVVVTRQQFLPHRQLSEGTRVSVTLGPPETHKPRLKGR
jgi:hypothetical protein